MRVYNPIRGGETTDLILKTLWDMGQLDVRSFIVKGFFYRDDIAKRAGFNSSVVYKHLIKLEADGCVELKVVTLKRFSKGRQYFKALKPVRF